MNPMNKLTYLLGAVVLSAVVCSSKAEAQVKPQAPSRNVSTPTNSTT